MPNKSTYHNDGLGLDKLGAFDLSAMLEPVEEKFREVDVDLVREDGENPRHDFDPGSLEELAATIRSRGVITPISVRPDPEKEGGFIVNHGHRRLRAARLAGLGRIPAVIDTSFRDEDRIIENIQRDNLSMFEVARYIERKAREGMKQKDIAALIGKSTAYVSNHVRLLSLPPHTSKVVAENRVTDLTTITDLAKMEKQHPEAVEAMLAGKNTLTRSDVRELRNNLDAAIATTPASNEDDERFGKGTGQGTGAVAPVKNETKSQESGITEDEFENRAPKWTHGIVVVEMNGMRGVLQLDRKPKTESHVWVKWEDTEEEYTEELLSHLALKAVMQG